VPDLRDVPLADIDEPAIAGRIAMDEGKLAELAADIQRNGLLQPIGLKPRGERWEIEYGHRRFLAVQMNGAPHISALCYAPGELKEGAALLSENYCREETTAAEDAVFIAELQEKHGLDEAALCQALGRTADWIGDRLRLLRGDREVFDAIAQRKVKFAVGRELNKCPNEEMRRYYLYEAIRCGSTARIVAGWVENYKATLAPQTETEQPASPSPQVEQRPVAPYRPSCCLCGGAEDPYNLESVMIHRWELEEIRKLRRKMAEV
jgi:ParB family chromosome partitioning protein